ncbi:MAG: hypothetical protein LC792_08895, partial [Actinobacteria bacterium]|nr:hypothetical protein [Actinomycetota bacterium]
MEEGTAKSGGPGPRVLTARSPAAQEQSNGEAGLDRKSGWHEPLQRLALALVRAVSLDDVAAAAVAYGTAAAGARWGHVLLLDEHGAPSVSLLGGPGVPSRRLDRPDFECPETSGPVVTAPLEALGEECGALTFGFDGPASGEAAASIPLDDIAALTGRAAARAAVYA